jgi:hypothetical protein
LDRDRISLTTGEKRVSAPENGPIGAIILMIYQRLDCDFAMLAGSGILSGFSTASRVGSGMAGEFGKRLCFALYAPTDHMIIDYIAFMSYVGAWASHRKGYLRPADPKH